MRYLIVCLLSMLFVAHAICQSTQKQQRAFALTNGTIYTVANGVIEGGTVVIREGKIVAVGNDVTLPKDAKVMDCKGLNVYPGFIDSGTRLGLSEVGSDPRTQDYHEVGEVNPQVKALTAINPNSALIPVTRVNGVTTVLSSPTGGLFSGTAALVNLYGYTPDQMYAGFQGIVLNFPNTSRKGKYDKRTDEEIKNTADKEIKNLNDLWEKAIQYYKIDSATGGKDVRYYPEMEALAEVVSGQTPLLIEVNVAKDISSALKWVKDKNIKRAILTGVAEGWRVADEIATSGIPVIVGPVLSLPARGYDRYDKPYANASLLRKAGVKVALRTNETENVRNLPYHAGFAATYGMGREEALKAITTVPAEIFGVADKLGSIEAGKVANLFVCDGDPFETKTQIRYLFIEGWQVPLISRQTELYEEFLHREPGLQED